MNKNFNQELEKFIESYIAKKFPADLKENYGNLIGILKAGIYAGADFASKFHKKHREIERNSEEYPSRMGA